MAKRKAYRDWFKLEIAGSQWRVLLSTAKEIEDLARAEGVTLPSDQVIVIDQNIPIARRGVVLMHELLHAMLSNVGAKVTTSTILGCTVNESEKVEEQLVSYFAPILYDTLMRNGMLKLPK